MAKCRILVVEDEKVVATDIEECLLQSGYAVVGSAASGVCALRKAVETRPDLVLMDIKLKGRIDGVDVASELYHRLGIPVVYLTAYADSETLERAKKTVPAGFVLKPFDNRSLRAAIEIALYRHQTEGRLSRAFSSNDEALIITEQRGRVELMNPMAEELTGWRQQEALGRPVAEVFTTIDERTGSIRTAPVSRVMAVGEAAELSEDTTLIGRQGQEAPIKGRAWPIREEDGKLTGAALAFRHRLPGV